MGLFIFHFIFNDCENICASCYHHSQIVILTKQEVLRNQIQQKPIYRCSYNCRVLVKFDGHIFRCLEMAAKSRECIKNLRVPSNACPSYWLLCCVLLFPVGFVNSIVSFCLACSAYILLKIAMLKICKTTIYSRDCVKELSLRYMYNLPRLLKAPHLFTKWHIPCTKCFVYLYKYLLKLQYKG